MNPSHRSNRRETANHNSPRRRNPPRVRKFGRWYESTVWFVQDRFAAALIASTRHCQALRGAEEPGPPRRAPYAVATPLNSLRRLPRTRSKGIVRSKQTSEKVATSSSALQHSFVQMRAAQSFSDLSWARLAGASAWREMEIAQRTAPDLSRTGTARQKRCSSTSALSKA